MFWYYTVDTIKVYTHGLYFHVETRKWLHCYRYGEERQQDGYRHEEKPDEKKEVYLEEKPYEASEDLARLAGTTLFNHSVTPMFSHIELSRHYKEHKPIVTYIAASLNEAMSTLCYPVCPELKALDLILHCR